MQLIIVTISPSTWSEIEYLKNTSIFSQTLPRRYNTVSGYTVTPDPAGDHVLLVNGEYIPEKIAGVPSNTVKSLGRRYTLYPIELLPQLEPLVAEAQAKRQASINAQTTKEEAWATRQAALLTHLQAIIPPTLGVEPFSNKGWGSMCCLYLVANRSLPSNGLELAEGETLPTLERVQAIETSLEGKQVKYLAQQALEGTREALYSSVKDLLPTSWLVSSNAAPGSVYICPPGKSMGTEVYNMEQCKEVIEYWAGISDDFHRYNKLMESKGLIPKGLRDRVKAVKLPNYHS
jgi:hypothetical protein